MTQDVVGTPFDQTWGFTWSPASQLLTRTSSNAAYKWATPTPGTTANAYDGLNRDSAIVTAGGYDARGNLTADGGRTFTYDVENRMLTAVNGGTTVTFAYDPIGRLSTTAVPTATTFLYDSDRLVAEYDASGAVLRRYVHGPGVDEPLVWVESGATHIWRWLHQDRQGSVIGWSRGDGVMEQVYKYGPWGEPGDNWGAGSRFRYTGQTAIPEARLYHYKARMYDPATGRFMQTDPIGYKDDLDLYAYVGGDPINRTDPTGQCGVFITVCVGAAVGAGIEIAVQMTDADTRADYAEAGRALANGDIGGAVDAAGEHVLDVAVSAGAGALGDGVGGVVTKKLGGTALKMGAELAGDIVGGATGGAAQAAGTGRDPVQGAAFGGAVGAAGRVTRSEVARPPTGTPRVRGNPIQIMPGLGGQARGAVNGAAATAQTVIEGVSEWWKQQREGH